MESSIHETIRAQEIRPRFDYLSHLVHLTSGASVAIGIAASVLLSNTQIALAGIGTAGISLYALASSRDRASHTAATLLISSDETWQNKLAEIQSRSQVQINALVQERDALKGDRLTQTRKLDALSNELSGLHHAKAAIERQFKQAQLALDQSQSTLQEKRLDLEVHLEATENQMLEVWEPLFNGLIAVCNRYDSSQPSTLLDYAGKPLDLDERERQQWRHYRDYLVAYDADLRDRISRISDECESHDEAYGVFVKLLEELTLNYCKLWANIKDLELLNNHEGEKQAIYSEFQDFRSSYVSEASTWVEQSSKVEAGFGYIEQSFKNELASLQDRIIAAERLIEELQAPRSFRGETSIDKAGNRIIAHFAESGVILDAIESVKIPGGFQLRFKVDRNLDNTRLTESEFDKHCEHLGLWGLSQRPLDFALDTRNFLLSVDLFTVPDAGNSRPAVLSSSVRSTNAAAAKPAQPDPDSIALRFQELECFSAAEFEEVVKLKFVPRVRVVAGSTGGKSPLLELIACAIGRTQGGEIWLINPIPGSPKDWFHIPGVVPPGTDGIQAAIDWLGKAHAEFKTRRNDLPRTANKPFVTIVVDEINAIARDFPDLGTVVKDFYQLSDHTRMGFLTAGQGGNVSGVSGGSKSAAKTGNASKLMEEDFQNATQVFTAAAAKTWVKKHLGSEATLYLDRLLALNQLCDELNQAEGKSAYPSDPTSKIVSPDAYRVALVVSPSIADPFFIQLPPYSSYHGRMEGVSYPKGSIVTAPQPNQKALKLNSSLSDRLPDFTCSHCGSHSRRRKGFYKNGEARYVCAQCVRVSPSPD